jgi:hypothetical protein
MDNRISSTELVKLKSPTLEIEARVIKAYAPLYLSFKRHKKIELLAIHAEVQELCKREKKRLGLKLRAIRPLKVGCDWKRYMGGFQASL